jgi:hypothetical protein
MPFPLFILVLLLLQRKRIVMLTQASGRSNRRYNMRGTRNKRLHHCSQQHGGSQMVEMHGRRWEPGDFEYQLSTGCSGRVWDV